MKSLILIVVSLVVCGVFWFRTGALSDSNVSKNAIEYPPVITSDRASSSSAKTTDQDHVDIVHEASNNHVGPTRKELLEEYWTSLLGDERDEWCPSLRVDKFKELSFIMTLEADEALEHLDALASLPEGYWEDDEFFASMLINQVASTNPREAMVFMVQSKFDFDYDDYESVARFWMDEEGVAIMDWYEKSELEDVNTGLHEAFLAVYAEENPYDYLIRYGSLDESYNNGEAAGLLYDQYGASVYEDLKLAGLEPEVLRDSFHSIGTSIFYEDPAAGRDWLLANRYSVNEQASTWLAKAMLGWGLEPNPETSLQNLEWAMSQRLISPDDAQVRDVVKRLGNNLPEASREALVRLQSQFGESVDVLLDVLPKPVVEEEVFYLTSLGVSSEEEDVYILSCGFTFTPEPSSEKVDQLVEELRAGISPDGTL